MNKKLLSLILFLVFSNAFAQYRWTEAEVYLPDGKIHRGEALLTVGAFGGKERLRFRNVEKKKRTRTNPSFLASEVDSVVFTVKYKQKVGRRRALKTRKEKYIPINFKKNNKKTGFAQLIYDGELKFVGRTTLAENTSSTKRLIPFYSSAYGFFSNHDQFLLIKEDRKAKIFTGLSLKKFYKRFEEYFEDCPLLIEKLENENLKKEDMKIIVDFYNSNCN